MRAVLAAWLALSGAFSPAPPPPTAAFVWSGLEGHAWRRRLLGVPTPHRLSSLSAWLSAGRAGVGFAPGADGDWARPGVLFAELPGATGARDGADLGVVVLQGQDEATRGPASGHLSASVRLEARACAPKPAAAGNGALAAAGLLQGFNLTTSCDPSRQPPGVTCAGDGAWLTRLSLSVQCGIEAAHGACGEAPGSASSGRSCLVEFEAERAKCPDSVIHPLHRPKPFDLALDWRLEVHLGSIAAGPGQGRAHVRVVPQPRVRADARPFLSPRLEPVRVTFRGPGAGERDGGGEAAAVAVALQGFGFQLHAPGAGPAARLPAGRYMEEFAFACEPAEEAGAWIPGPDGSVDAECHLGVRASARSLVWPAYVDAWLDAALVSLHGTPPGLPARAQRAAAEVCASGDPGSGDLLFSCHRRGLPERLSAVVALEPPT